MPANISALHLESQSNSVTMDSNTYIDGTGTAALDQQTVTTSIGLASTTGATMRPEYIAKKELREDDIVEAAPRRRQGMYDRILNQKWEIYESKSHEQKDDFAGEILKEMMEKHGVRFLSKRKHPLSGEEVFEVHRQVTFQCKQKLKRDIKSVVNDHHSRLGLTRKQIEERKQKFKQQRNKESDEKVIEISSQSAQRQLFLMTERTKPTYLANEKSQSNPQVPNETHIDVQANLTHPPVSAFEHVARPSTRDSRIRWVDDQQKRGYISTQDVQGRSREIHGPKYIGEARVPTSGTPDDLLEPLHVSSAVGYHTLGSDSFEERTTDRSLSPLQGHQLFADLPHDGSGQFNLEDIFDDETTNSSATLPSNVAIGQAISNLSPKRVREPRGVAQHPLAGTDLHDQGNSTLICYESGHMGTTTMQPLAVPPKITSTNNFAATWESSRYSTDWRNDLEYSVRAGYLLNARLLSNLHRGRTYAIEQQIAEQRLKQEEDVGDDTVADSSIYGHDSDKRARSEAFVAFACKKRRTALVGVTGMDTSSTDNSSFTADDRRIKSKSSSST